MINEPEVPFRRSTTVLLAALTLAGCASVRTGLPATGYRHAGNLAAVATEEAVDCANTAWWRLLRPGP
ncbi:MAG: hypothetical protein R3F37_20240 [Candidatus Competibacteraceae bacterium]